MNNLDYGDNVMLTYWDTPKFCDAWNSTTLLFRVGKFKFKINFITVYDTLTNCLPRWLAYCQSLVTVPYNPRNGKLQTSSELRFINLDLENLNRQRNHNRSRKKKRQLIIMQIRMQKRLVNNYHTMLLDQR